MTDFKRKIENWRGTSHHWLTPSKMMWVYQTDWKYMKKMKLGMATKVNGCQMSTIFKRLSSRVVNLYNIELVNILHQQ
jgi:hypothetical protein